MENDSEIRRRGRPRIDDGYRDPGILDSIRADSPGLRSHRAILNTAVMFKAGSAIGTGGEAEFNWLWNAKEQKYRKTILAELGRLDDRESIRAVARHLCEVKPSTAKAVALIRRARGVSQSAGVESLVNRIVATITGFLELYPATQTVDVKAALQEIADRVERLG